VGFALPLRELKQWLDVLGESEVEMTKLLMMPPNQCGIPGT
jgi:outer membrane biogenesis lipoprotein LolB